MDIGKIIIVAGCMISLLSWVFIITNKKQVIVSMQALALLSAIARLKIIRKHYQQIGAMHTTRSVLLEITKLQELLTNMIATSKSVLENGMFEPREHNKTLIALARQHIDRLEQVQKLVIGYEQWIQQRT